MADRFSVERSPYDHEPEGEMPHLIEFRIRGARGALKGRSTVDRRMALRYWTDLSELLGIDISNVELPEDPRAHRRT